MIQLSYSKKIAIIKLDNEQKLNALSNDFMQELSEKIREAKNSSNVIILRGGDKAFAAGVDISEIKKYSYEDAILNDFMGSAWECIFNLEIPIIAAVSGYALGGGFELSLMCDIIIAAKNAQFGFPEVNLGVMPGFGGTQILTKIIGAKIASELMLTGRRLNAQEAYNLKIASEVVEVQNLLSKAMEVATEISEKSPLSTRLIKKAIRIAQNTTLTEGIKIERQMFKSLFSTSFKEEGINAFLEKRKPNFKK